MTNGNKFYFPVNYNINGRKNSLSWSLHMRSSIILKGGKTPSKYIVTIKIFDIFRMNLKLITYYIIST